MYIIVCVDKNRGMMFGNKRQSQDSILRQKVMELSVDTKLWMNQYSAKQFAEYTKYIVSDNFLNEAGPGEFCFVENETIPESGVEKIYVFCWNRKYPGDVFFDFDLTANGFKRESKTEFAGSSHDKITLEVYKKEE